MSDPKEQQREDELELEPETVRDLELDENAADDVRGGGTVEYPPGFTLLCPKNN